MRMRTRRFIIFLFACGAIFVSPHLSAEILTAERHLPLSSDSLQAYKLPYIEVTDSGRNCIWDFSNLSTDSAEIIEVNYFAPSSDTTRIGLHREHANYYYRTTRDTLWLTGYETSRTHVQYPAPLPCLKFPFAYGDSLQGAFFGKGQYCHIVPVNIEGTCSVRADAAGQLVLPETDTVSVLRFHSLIQYREKTNRQTHVQEERFMWYSPYCRYPLLETVHVQTMNGTDTVSFASSYYFPQEKEDIPAREIEQQVMDSLIVDVDSLITDVAYMPNPVYSDLRIKYTLSRSAQVYISLHYNGGVTTYQTPVHQEEDGSHTVSLTMAGMPVGTYVVYIHADDTIVSGNIVKL